MEASRFDAFTKGIADVTAALEKFRSNADSAENGNCMQGCQQVYDSCVSECGPNPIEACVVICKVGWFLCDSTCV